MALNMSIISPSVAMFEESTHFPRVYYLSRDEAEPPSVLASYSV